MNGGASRPLLGYTVNDGISIDGNIFSVNLINELAYELEYTVNYTRVTKIQYNADKYQRAEYPIALIHYVILNSQGGVIVEGDTPVQRGYVDMYNGSAVDVSEIIVSGKEDFPYLQIDGIAITGCKDQVNCLLPDQNRPIPGGIDLPTVINGPCFTLLKPMSKGDVMGSNAAVWFDLFFDETGNTLDSLVPDFSFEGLEICPKFVSMGRIVVGDINIEFTSLLSLIVSLALVRKIIYTIGGMFA
jgi:hypothetical protein